MGSWLNAIRMKLRSIFRNDAVENELNTEMSFHLDNLIERNIENGMEPSAARREALKNFGNVEALKEDSREFLGVRVLTELLRDIRFSLRMFWKSKGYTAILIFTFVFCVGPCVLVFNIFNSLYLNPDRYPEEDRIVRIYDEFENYSASGERRRGTNWVLYNERKEQSQYIESIDAQIIDHRNVRVDRDNPPEFVDVMGITPSMFDVLKIEPRLGRRFYETDIGIGTNEKVVIITHQWWRTHYNEDPDAVGRTLMIDGEPWEIVGVMPEGFSLPPFAGRWDVASIGLLTPNAPSDRHVRPERRYRISPIGCLARLKPGVTKDMIESELASINALNAEAYPAFGEFQRDHPLITRTITVGEDQIRDLESTFLLGILMSGFVFVAGSLSIVNFVLARNSHRIQELATRASLGANTNRLVRQLISESGIVAFLGCVFAVFLTQFGLQALNYLGMFDFFPMAPRLNADFETVVVAIFLSFAIAAICGLVSIFPMLTRGGLSSHLKDGSRSSTGSVSLKKYRGALVLIQSAIALALLINGGLLTRSFVEILRIDPGYETENLLYATVRPPDGRYTQEERFSKMLALERRIQMLPEVVTAGLTNWPPMKHPNISRNRVVRFESPVLQNAPVISMDMVSPGYFEALGISAMKGRLFQETDVVTEAEVVVIDAALASRLFPDEDPIGKRIALHSAGGHLHADVQPRHSWQTIIGVINPVRINDLYTPSSGMVYRHVGGRHLYWFGFVVKVRSTIQDAIRSMQDLLLLMESNVAVGHPLALDLAIAKRYAERKNILYFCLGLASIGLGLAILGVSGMIAYSIAAQKKEIGIRLALGASRRAILVGSVTFWLKLAAIGIGVGLIASVAFSGETRGLLYETEPLDLPTYVLATLLFSAVIIVTAYSTARRTTMIHPLDAIKDW